jgi:hypothetical protein
MNKKTKIILIGTTVLLTFAVIGQIYTKTKGRIEFEKFNDSEISGVIETKVDASVSGTHFQVKRQRYKFHPFTADINSNSIFSYTAEVGDSVFKKKGGDTLILIKAERTYKYTFSKLVDK